MSKTLLDNSNNFKGLGQQFALYILHINTLYHILSPFAKRISVCEIQRLVVKFLAYLTLRGLAIKFFL